jgi:DNA-binding response OmpR family regulator
LARQRPTVLCIEDGYARGALESHGYEVVTVSSARDALSALSDCEVDAAILDGEAPGVNSAPLVRRMKQIKPHIPVLLLITRTTRIPSGKIPAADAVVMKSESPVRLLKALDHLLNVRFPFFTRWFGNWKHRVSA